MVQQNLPPMPPDEAQEYLGKLQAGKVTLHAGAGPIEREALAAMQDASKRVRELTTQMGDNNKQLEFFKRQSEALQARVNECSGEMSGYARLLISAEGARRKATAELKAKANEPEEIEAKKAEEKASVTKTAAVKVEELDAPKEKLQAPPPPPVAKARKA